MSSGDYLRYLRALKGGPDLITVGQGSGVAPRVLREIEQRYRPIGDREILTKLAHYYGVPPEELIWRHEWSRKSLSNALEAAQQQNYPLRVNLRTGESFQGKVIWWDLGALLLELEDGRQLVVQRHMVETWEPRADGAGI
jgi:sRNA-binding regulator protein Hfq